MGTRTRHHLVSRGYLRAWTDRDGRITYIDKTTCTTKLIGTRDAFVAPKLLTLDRGDGPTDELETRFGRVESLALPLLRKWSGGADGPEHVAAVRALIALHFARSDAIRRLYPILWDETIVEQAREVESDETMIEAFIQTNGRPPRKGEIGALLVASSEQMVKSNVLLPDSIERLYGQALDHFATLHLQRVTVQKPRRGEFIVADSPVVLSVGGEVARNRPTPLMDADLLWFPVSPTTGASVTSNRLADVTIDEKAAWRINNLTWDHAHRFVAASPDSRIDRLFGIPGRSIATDGLLDRGRG